MRTLSVLAIAIAIASLLPVPSAVQAAGGVTWTTRTAPSAYWAGVTYGAGIYAAVSSNTVMTSPDGITWTSQSLTGGWTDVTYANGQFVAVGEGVGARAATSLDGLDWTLQPGLSTARYRAVTFGNSTYVAVAQQWAAYSTDGITWTETNIDPVTANQWRSVAFGNNTFVALNYNTGTSIPVMTSTDGITWTQRTAGISVEQWNGVTYGAGKFVAVGGTGTHRVMTSVDGIAWTSHIAPDDEYWRAVTYSSGQFTAVGHSGAVMTSPDGENWTAQTSGNSGIWRAITGGPQLVAVGQTSGLPVMTSFIDPAPTVTMVSPTTGSTLGGTTITLTGTGMISGAVVDIGGSACTNISVLSSTQLTCTTPPGFAGSTNITVTNPDSQTTTASGAFTYAVPAPEPTPAVPAGPPTDVSGNAGDRSVSLNWAAPTSTGSFPVTNYQVRSTPAGGTCLTTTLACKVTGLRNGVDYTFTVRALTGAGWSPWSASSNVVTPERPIAPSIMITGSRGEVRGKVGVVVAGRSSGLGMGAILVPWVRIGDAVEFTEGRARILVDTSGDFTWQRRGRATLHVQMRTASGESSSNILTILRR